MRPDKYSEKAQLILAGVNHRWKLYPTTLDAPNAPLTQREARHAASADGRSDHIQGEP